MAKRLFSTDKRAETILSDLRDKGENVSQYISNAVVDETLPVYSQLRTEALYLLDFITDGAKDWTGNKLILNTGEDEIQFHTKQTLSRGISWLRRNHHIKNANAIRTAISHYQQSSLNGGITMENMSDHVKESTKKMYKKLSEIDTHYTNSHAGLGAIGRDVLEHWEVLWNDDDAYDILISVFYCENTIGKLDPFMAIKTLQAIENQFIIEAIGERN